ncbi:MAG: Ig-like domain-containing protein [Saprospiraceae bacterium]
MTISTTLYRCANIGQPDGGVRDLDPPIMDSAESTKGLQRNFHPDQTKAPISLIFNEWIKLDDAFKQVIVSPPLQYPPKIELKGKGIKVNLDPREVLLPQTTYTINFGKSIKDLTEGNIVKDLRFVFSTGDIIDTGKISGKVYDALTGEPKEELLVMLYTSNEDTMVFKKKPIYFNRTDKGGVFNIQNIKDTTYKIAVLEDANSNYIYDQDKELFGFLTRRVNAGEDSTTINIPFYKSYIRPKILSYSTDVPGIVKLVTNITLEDLKTRILNDSLGKVQSFLMLSKDSLHVYYLPVSAQGWDLEISDKNKVFDTIAINKFKKLSIDSFKPTLVMRSQQSLAPGGYKEMEFNHPTGMTDTVRMTFIDDTTKTNIPIHIKPGTATNILEIYCPCEEAHTYTYTFLPGAIKDYAGNSLKDTIRLKLKGLTSEETGVLILDITELDSTKDYTISLMENNKPVRINNHTGTSAFHVEYRYLAPGSYDVQILEDLNKNSRWDGGDYLNKIQPEKIFLQKNYSVRANWEIREQLKWKP